MAAPLGLRQESIQGTVRDSRGRAVAGGAIVPLRGGTASQLTRTHSVQGTFPIAGPGAGRYWLEMRAAGFRVAAVSAANGPAVALNDGLRIRDAATTEADSGAFHTALSVIQVDRVGVLHRWGSSLHEMNAMSLTVNVASDAGGGPLPGGLQLEGGSLELPHGRAPLAGGRGRDEPALIAGSLHTKIVSGEDGDDRARRPGKKIIARRARALRFSLTGRTFVSGEFVQPNMLRYWNRISDSLWLCWRQIEHASGVKEVLREGKTPQPRRSRAW